VGVTLGDGTLQLKIASKFNALQGIVGLGVGVGHITFEKYVSHKSGQTLTQGDLPNKRQSPSKTVDKHH
jgi:hypothetical protein